MAVVPPRPPGTPGPPQRHHAASHPGFEEDELPTGARNLGIGQVIATVNAGFQRVQDTIALDREVANLRAQITKVEHAFEVEKMQRMAALDRVDARLKDLEKDVEDTGQHRQQDIERELERMRGSQAHWVRYAIAAIVAFVAAMLLAVLTRLVK